MAKKKTARGTRAKTRKSKSRKSQSPKKSNQRKAASKRGRSKKRAAQGERLAGWELVTKEAVFGHLKSSKIPVTKLARAIGVSPAAVYSWKAGRRFPSAEAQRKLAGIVSGKTPTNTTTRRAANLSDSGFKPSDLRSTREAHGLSRGALASRLGVSSSSLFNWESGKSVPQGQNLAKIARFMSEVQPVQRATAVEKAPPRERVGSPGSPEAALGAAQVASAYLAAGHPLSASQVIAFVRDLRKALS